MVYKPLLIELIDFHSQICNHLLMFMLTVELYFDPSWESIVPTKLFSCSKYTTKAVQVAPIGTFIPEQVHSTGPLPSNCTRIKPRHVMMNQQFGELPRINFGPPFRRNRKNHHRNSQGQVPRCSKCFCRCVAAAFLGHNNNSS